jgi:histidine triad (HIT) family protein
MSDKAKPCVFCAIINGEATAEIIDDSEHYIAFLDHRPLFHGHTLLVPKLHVQLLSDLPADRVGSWRRKDGLRFWLGPRHPYDADHPAAEYAAKIRAALPAR